VSSPSRHTTPPRRARRDDVDHERISCALATSSPLLGEALDEALERREVRRGVRVDVDVVVLDRGDDRDLGAVVPELRRLLEEGRVVLVALDDEGGAPPSAQARLDARGSLPRGRAAKLSSKFFGRPPIRKPGSRPATSSRYAARALVVVLPCVPPTTSGERPASTCSARAWAMEA
jgi:hypothetical protein